MTRDRIILVGDPDETTPDLTAAAPTVGHVLTVGGGGVPAFAAPAASGAPTTADYLVGTAQAGLSAEIVVGTSPGGELGGTWASPTVDTTHSGSSHSGVVSTHEAAADPHTGYVLESLLDAKGDIYAASAADTPAKVTVGANGSALVADSGQTAGLRWATGAVGEILITDTPSTPIIFADLLLTDDELDLLYADL